MLQPRERIPGSPLMGALAFLLRYLDDYSSMHRYRTVTYDRPCGSRVFRQSLCSLVRKGAFSCLDSWKWPWWEGYLFTLSWSEEIAVADSRYFQGTVTLNSWRSIPSPLHSRLQSRLLLIEFLCDWSLLVDTAILLFREIGEQLARRLGFYPKLSWNRGIQGEARQQAPRPEFVKQCLI